MEGSARSHQLFEDTVQAVAQSDFTHPFIAHAIHALRLDKAALESAEPETRQQALRHLAEYLVDNGLTITTPSRARRHSCDPRRGPSIPPSLPYSPAEVTQRKLELEKKKLERRLRVASNLLGLAEAERKRVDQVKTKLSQPRMRSPERGVNNEERDRKIKDILKRKYKEIQDRETRALAHSFKHPADIKTKRRRRSPVTYPRIVKRQE